MKKPDMKTNKEEIQSHFLHAFSSFRKGMFNFIASFLIDPQN